MKNIKIGLAGYGGIAKTHVIALYAMRIMYPDLPFQVILEKVYRRDPGADKGPFHTLTASWDDLVQDPEIGLIDICTPNYLHYDQVKQALAYQKPVYCEKPLAMNYREALELANLAQEHEIIQQVALMYRFMPAVVKAREYIKQGRLGDILHFKFALHHKGYLSAERPLSWRQESRYGGAGALMDLGIHLADLIRYMLGEVEEVQAQLYTYHKERPLGSGGTGKGQVDVDDYAKVDLKLQNGAMGTMECSRISAELHEGTYLEIYGSNGSIKISSLDPYYPVVHQHDCNRTVQGELEVESDFVRHVHRLYPGEKMSLSMGTDMHLASLANLLHNLTQGFIEFEETPTFWEAAQAQKIIDLALLSAREKRPQKVQF